MLGDFVSRVMISMIHWWRQAIDTRAVYGLAFSCLKIMPDPFWYMTLATCAAKLVSNSIYCIKKKQDWSSLRRVILPKPYFRHWICHAVEHNSLQSLDSSAITLPSELQESETGFMKKNIRFHTCLLWFVLLYL